MPSQLAPLHGVASSIGRIPVAIVAFGVLISGATWHVTAAEEAPEGSLTPCEKTYGEIRKALDAVPKDFRTVTSDQAQQIAKQVCAAAERGPALAPSLSEALGVTTGMPDQAKPGGAFDTLNGNVLSR